MFRPASRTDSTASSSDEPLVNRTLDGVTEQNAVYAAKRSRVLSLIEQTRDLLQDLSASNTSTASIAASSGTLNAGGTPQGPQSGGAGQNAFNVRAMPTAYDERSPAVLAAQGLPVLSVLGLDGSDAAMATTTGDIETHVLAAKMADALVYIDRLLLRIADTRSRVLVTGDLNGGKSTFVNALLRRQVVPDDQQPCTALFAEVVDASQNDGKEEVHGIPDASKYDRTDPFTYTAFSIDILREVVEENEPGYEMLKVYCSDTRPRDTSVLHNGIVDVSLIDSPGLNIDSMKTTSLMAQQEEIDVIVFVVNAENHFTLSGREFLQNAGKEKSYIFIVVNRFDQIRRKDRCKKDILSQIKEISPLTYQNRDQLVHFVAAKQTLEPNPPQEWLDSFTCLENNLRSFILEKRARSKLNPAKMYLAHLLGDMSTLCTYNHALAVQQVGEISGALSATAPAFERMLRIKEQFLDDATRTIEDSATRAHAFARDQLGNFLEGIETYVEDVEWGGVLGMWQYARELRNAVYRHAAVRLRRCEDFAVKSSVGCVKNIEAMAESCMETPPVVDMAVVTTAFEDGSAEAGRAAAMSLFVPLELGDFFDFVDKIEILKEYVPSLGLMLGGIFGYHSVTMGMWRADQTMVRGKTAFLGISLAGVGLFLYSLSDMKNVVDRKVLGKIKSHLITAGLVDANSERIARGTRRVLRLAIWEFQNQFQRVMIDSQMKRQDLVEKRSKAEMNKDEFRALGARVSTLQRIVQEIDLD
ncbi:P-loop containing nucleoside triphosphate hydrolase protein [Chytriomyces sp. MP71]|nr:P-loop containing nucleoside triphosphate hydrolase protein [Chytriomyces sp. MP71]